MDKIDQQLISLLRKNGRATTTALAQTLGLSRSTVQDRISRLEKKNIIAGYTIRFNEDYRRRQITAHVMIRHNPKFADHIIQQLKDMPPVRAVYTVSGIYDLIALVRAETTEDIDMMLDDIGRLKGVEKTTSSIVLSTKFEN